MHNEVFNELENSDNGFFEDMRILFLTNFKGDVDRATVPFKRAVDENNFTRRLEAKLSDPEYLGRFTGV